LEDMVHCLRADFLKALASPLRLKIIEALRGGEKSVCELVDALGVCQSTLSCNLAVLRTSGAVLDRKEGCSVYYRVSNENVYALVKTLDKVLKAQCRQMTKALDTL